MNLQQGNRSLHELTDPLNADSQSQGDFAIAETFGAQQNALTLLGRELGEGVFKLAHSLLEDDLLFGSRSGVYAMTNDGVRLVRVGGRPASMEAMNIHRKIVSNTKQPGAKIFVRASPEAIAHQSKKCFLNHVFGLVGAHAEGTKVRME